MKIGCAERRQTPRLAEEFDAEAVVLSGRKLGDQIRGKVVNLSKEGLGIVFPPGLDAGDRLDLIIYSDEDNSSIGHGKVVWVKDVQGRLVHGVTILQWAHLDPAVGRGFSGG